MKSIIDSKDLNTRLHSLYFNRQLLEFTLGTQWFDQQVLAIWTEWLKYQPKWPSEPGSIQAQIDSCDTVEFSRGCWEIEHGYFIEETAQ